MKIVGVIAFASALAGIASAFPQDRDGAPAYGKPQDGYFQYVNVPGPKEYEFGWNRGNPDHYVSRYEQSKDHRFRTRVRWGDKQSGYGEQYWEYNHGPSPYQEEKIPTYQVPKYTPAAASS